MDPGPFSGRIRSNPLDKPIGKPRAEISLNAYALLFAELVQYCQNRVLSVNELKTRLNEMGRHVGERLLDMIYVRDKNWKRETRLLNMLLLVKNQIWKQLFGKEADRLEAANDDETVYYIIESEPIVNKFISVPKDKGGLNCAAFVGGILEAVFCSANFPCTVTVHWYKGSTFMIKFNEEVIKRDKAMESK